MLLAVYLEFAFNAGIVNVIVILANVIYKCMSSSIYVTLASKP